MKNLKNIFMLAALVCSFLTAFAQQNENSLLWKVEGNGIKTSYVFGTFHMLPKKDFELKGKVTNALQNSEILVLELDMDDPKMQTEMMQLSALTDGKTLSEFMDAEEYTLIDTYLKEKMGMGLDNFKTFKPLLVSTMVMMGYLGKDMASYEASLIKLTKEQQKEVKGLETVAFQMGIFDEQPYEQQLDDIIKLLKEETIMKDMFTEMITLYKNENIDGLYDYMDDFFNGDKAQLERMLHNRNQNWIPKMGEYSKEQTVFYGVGAGHLGGKLGVINLLRAAGYTVTPVLK
ncbi:MAG: TraB/GumN family protein [Flavobacteriaceae bacterium]|nr:TraB/GumN family protein [Flavobacteriaceae bacterium]